MIGHQEEDSGWIREMALSLEANKVLYTLAHELDMPDDEVPFTIEFR